jgi:hypothetical protein
LRNGKHHYKKELSNPAAFKMIGAAKGQLVLARRVEKSRTILRALSSVIILNLIYAFDCMNLLLNAVADIHNCWADLNIAENGKPIL